MNWVDYVILAVIAVSVLISLVRGFVREVISISVWVAAFLLASRFAWQFGGYFAQYIDSPLLRAGTAFAIIFIGVLLAGALVNYLVGLLVTKTGLSGTDRALGMIFGAGRGLVIVALVMMLLGLFTSVPDEEWWGESVIVGYLQPPLCRLVINGWLSGVMIYNPISQDATASGQPAPEYWREFCSGF